MCLNQKKTQETSLFVGTPITQILNYSNVWFVCIAGNICIRVCLCSITKASLTDQWHNYGLPRPHVPFPFHCNFPLSWLLPSTVSEGRIHLVSRPHQRVSAVLRWACHWKGLYLEVHLPLAPKNLPESREFLSESPVNPHYPLQHCTGGLVEYK